MAATTPTEAHVGQSLGTWGAALGLLFGIGLGSLRVVAGDMLDAFSLGDIAFLVS